MRKAVVQIFVKTNHKHLNWQNENVINYSMQMAKAYAKKHGADYFLISEEKLKIGHPTFERFQLLDDSWWENYDAVLYLDTDAFPWLDNEESIFDHIDLDKMNVVQHCSDPGFSFNAGVLVFTKVAADFIKQYFDVEKVRSDFAESIQNHDNIVLFRILNKDLSKVKVLDKLWNFKNGVDCHITHMWGKKKAKKDNSLTVAVLNKAKNQL
jgi:hypothetical protein